MKMIQTRTLTTSAHQKKLLEVWKKVTKSKCKYNKLKNSERMNKCLLLQEYLVVVIKTS